MMSRFPVFLFLFLASMTAASAQGPVLLLKGGPSMLNTFYGERDGGETYFGGSLAMERQISSRFSFSFGVQYHTTKDKATSGTLTVDARYRHIMIDPEIRWYPKRATEGFYLGLAPTLNIIKDDLIVLSSTLGAITDTYEATQLGAHLRLGYQFALSPHIKMQFGTGFGIIFPGDDYDGVIQVPVNALIGYQF